MKFVIVALIAVLGLAFSVPASAATIPLSVSLDGPQANAGAGSGSPGTGTATLSFDTVTKALTWSISWEGLDGTPALMHFHGPALPNQNAGVQIGTGVIGPPVVGNAILSASQEADLMAGLWYLNLHTDLAPSGEIRGQVLSQSVPNETLSLSLLKARFDR